MVYRGNSFSAEHPASLPEGDRYTGTGCSPGLVRGPVRLIHDPGQARLRHGEIIVAERTDPGWVMVFPAASGLLVDEVGGPPFYHFLLKLVILRKITLF